MKRTALYLGLPYTAGLLIASVVHRHFWFLAVGVILLAAAAVVRYRKDVWKYVLLSTLSVLTACCVYWCHDAFYVSRVLAYSERPEVEFSGKITSKTTHSSGYATYLLDGAFSDGQPARLQYLCDNSSYRYGDTLCLTGEAKTMESDYLFNEVSYRSAQNVFLKMEWGTQAVHLPRTFPSLRSILHEFRETMSDRIHASCDAESGLLLTGMLFGDKTGMASSTKTSLYRMGIGHILAVSGLHLDFLALCVVSLLRKCKADRRTAFGIMAALALLFVLCVGETVSVKRACIMILLSQSATLFFRTADTFNSLSIAMLLLAIENPMVVHGAGFWLSFCGAFGIGVLAPHMTAPLPAKTLVQRAFRALCSAVIVYLAVLPVSLVYFREVSLISPLANLLLVPLCMLAMLLTVLALVFGGGLGPIAGFLLRGAAALADAVLHLSRNLAALPWTHTGTQQHGAVIIVWLTCLLVLVCWILYRSRRWMCAAIALGMGMAVCSASFSQRYTDRNLRIAVLGDADHCVLVLHSGGEAVIVDASGTVQLSSYVNTYLQSCGIASVDTLYLCQPKAKSLTKYEQQLALYQPTRIFAAEPMKELEQPMLFDHPIVLQPEYEQLLDGALLSANENGAAIAYGGLRFVCSREKHAVLPEYDILTIYGTCSKDVPESSILIVLDEETAYTEDDYTYIGENNLELTITPSGDCRVRRLHANS